ncbi:hypothetical protein IQ238_04520 [Pleurocapsales cyanobacterium LEGE 06147]|nr:hypothetical protein [Pleurocapsales cyanobacterium LEGE 06147]
MVQEVTRDEPLYSCIVPLNSLTGNQEEELTTFGTSAQKAITQAEQILANNYCCDAAKIQKLMKLSRIEYLSPWCSPSEI